MESSNNKNSTEASSCHVATAPRQTQIQRQAAQDDRRLVLRATNIDVRDDNNLVVMQGRALVQQGGLTLQSDALRYERRAQRVTSPGTLQVTTPSMYLSGIAADFILHGAHTATDAQGDDQGENLNDNPGDASTWGEWRTWDDQQNEAGDDASDVAGDGDSPSDSDNTVDTTVNPPRLSGYIHDVEYALKHDSGSVSRGQAARVQIVSDNLVMLNDTQYTWCPPGNDDVIIEAEELHLNHRTGLGTARGATLRFKQLPIFHLPYLSFPTSDERKSGFLVPRIGYESNSGLIVQTPYYLNIAPFMDATLRPAWFARRGVQLGAEWRYLLARPTSASAHDNDDNASSDVAVRRLNNDTRQSGGLLDVVALPDDNAYKKNKPMRNASDNNDRWALHYSHRQNLGANWYGEVDWHDVSDGDYLSDFDNNLADSGLSYLPARAYVRYQIPRLQMQAGLSDWHAAEVAAIASPQNAPYSRAPYLHFRTHSPQRDGALYYELTSDATRFAHEHNDNIVGRRIFLQPTLGVAKRRAWGYMHARVNYHYTHYAYQNHATPRRTHTRRAPSFISDGALRFTRNIYDGRKIQSLTPHFFYVWRPYRVQQHLPIFDTTTAGSGTAEYLFLPNTYFGGDRTEDANRITLALSSTVLDSATGLTTSRVSLGRVFHIGTRRDASGAYIRGHGTLAGEVALASPRGWTSHVYLERTGDTRTISHARAEVMYQPTSAKVIATTDTSTATPGNHVRLAYHYQRQHQIEQLRLQVQQAVGARWRVQLGEWYSLGQRRDQRTDITMHYDACCWRLALNVQRRRDENGTARNAFYIRFGLNHQR